MRHGLHLLKAQMWEEEQGGRGAPRSSGLVRDNIDLLDRIQSTGVISGGSRGQCSAFGQNSCFQWHSYLASVAGTSHFFMFMLPHPIPKLKNLLRPPPPVIQKLAGEPVMGGAPRNKRAASPRSRGKALSRSLLPEFLFRTQAGGLRL